MSMKSTTMMPPISRSLSCRAISAAASRLTSRALVSWCILLVHPVACVNIDHMQGFGMLNDQINTTFDGHGLAKGAFYLLIDAKVLKYRRLALVKLNNIYFLGAIFPI